MKHMNTETNATMTKCTDGTDPVTGQPSTRLWLRDQTGGLAIYLTEDGVIRVEAYDQESGNTEEVSGFANAGQVVRFLFKGIERPE